MSRPVTYWTIRLVKARRLLLEMTEGERWQLLRELQEMMPNRPKGVVIETEKGRRSRYIKHLLSVSSEMLDKPSRVDVAKFAFEYSQSDQSREDQVDLFGKELGLTLDDFLPKHLR